MTEQLAENMAVRPTYEQIRDGIPHKEARELWRDADRRVEYARRAMQQVHDDANLSEEGKREKTQRIIDSGAPKILASYEDARKKAEAAASSSWKFSIPMPGDHKTLATTRVQDSSEMIAVRNEADSLARRLEGKSLQELTRERSRNPRDKGVREAPSHRLDALRAEFDAAMADGGIEGKIKALAIKRLCDETGMPIDDVVDHHRNQRHRSAYADAERLEVAAHSIPSGRKMAENPYDGNRRGGKNRIGTYGSDNTAIVSSGKPQIFQQKRRKPPWK